MKYINYKKKKIGNIKDKKSEYKLKNKINKVNHLINFIKSAFSKNQKKFYINLYLRISNDVFDTPVIFNSCISRK